MGRASLSKLPVRRGVAGKRLQILVERDKGVCSNRIVIRGSMISRQQALPLPLLDIVACESRVDLNTLEDEFGYLLTLSLLY